MFKTSKKSLVLFICLLLTVSCGGPAGTTSGRTLRNALSFAATMVEGLRLNAAPSVSALPGLGTATFAFSSGACDSVVTPSPLVDADADGIPVHIKHTFSCDNEMYGDGTVYSQNGSYDFYDKDDTQKWIEGGYKGNWDYEFETTVPASGAFSGGSFSYNGIGQFDSSKIGNSVVYKSLFNGAVGFETNANSGTYTYNGDFKFSVIPSAIPTYSAGKIEFLGTWRIQGTLPDEDDDHHGNSNSDGTVDAEIHISSSGVTYDSTCSYWYKTGKIIYTDLSGGIFESRYSCTAVKYFYNGKEWDPATAI